MVTVNDYLAQRDAEWMGRVHRFLGLSVGLIQVIFCLQLFMHSANNFCSELYISSCFIWTCQSNTIIYTTMYSQAGL